MDRLSFSKTLSPLLFAGAATQDLHNKLHLSLKAKLNFFFISECIDAYITETAMGL